MHVHTAAYEKLHAMSFLSCLLPLQKPLRVAACRMLLLLTARQALYHQNLTLSNAASELCIRTMVASTIAMGC